jgi:hypothetical protein
MRLNRASTGFLKIVIILLGIGALAVIIWEPRIEGRNAHADFVTIYFRDPFLAYAYIASLPFFAALYQAFKLLGYIDKNQVFSPIAVRALRTIKYCAIALIAFVVGGEIFIWFSPSDDRAGGVFMGILFTFASAVIATAAAVFEKLLQNAVDIKSENDLTV